MKQILSTHGKLNSVVMFIRLGKHVLNSSKIRLYTKS